MKHVICGEFCVPLTANEARRRRKRKKRFRREEAQESVKSNATLSIEFSGKRSGNVYEADENQLKRRREVAHSKGMGNVETAGFGTSQKLEKPYLRLTTFPRAEEVRPLSVLERCLTHVKKKYVDEDDFAWANEQLKSLRQDITVQGLRNSFVLEVYETHARMTLENWQLNEFNQCQSVIRSLTKGEGAPDRGKEYSCETRMETRSMEAEMFGCGPCNGALKQSNDTADEFAAYGLLYALVTKDWERVNNAFRLIEVTSERRIGSSRAKLPSSEHARKVTTAVIQNNFVMFFRLYDNAPNLSGYLMDFLVESVRLSAYKRMVATYSPSISVSFITDALSFHDTEETKEFLHKNRATIVTTESDGVSIDCKASRRRT